MFSKGVGNSGIKWVNESVYCRTHAPMPSNAQNLIGFPIKQIAGNKDFTKPFFSLTKLKKPGVLPKVKRAVFQSILN